MVALIGGFMALDRTALHWYVPEASDLGPLAARVDGIENQLNNVTQDVATLRGEVKTQSGTVPGRPAWHEANQSLRIQRLDSILALHLVNASLIPDASTTHPQVVACTNWLMSAAFNEQTGEEVADTGSSADCGLTLVGP